MIKETQTYTWSWAWGEGVGGMNWEIRFDINILLCVKYIASGNLLYSTGTSAQLSMVNRRDGVGV